MSSQKVDPSFWGNYPPFTFEGDVIRRIQENSQLHHDLGRLLESHLRIVQQSLQRDYPTIRCEVGDDFNIAIHQLMGVVHNSAEKLAEYLGGSLETIGDQLEILGLSAEKLVVINAQILEVMRNSLSNTARQYTEKGWHCFGVGELELAEIQLQKAVDSDITYSSAHYLLGYLYLRRLEWEKAARSLELAVKFAPSPEDRARGLLSQAKAYYGLGLYSKAFNRSLWAAKLFPNKASIWFEVAVYAARGKILNPSQTNLRYTSMLRRAAFLDSTYLRLAVGHPAFSEDPEIRETVTRMYVEDMLARQAQRTRQKEAEAETYRQRRQELAAKFQACMSLWLEVNQSVELLMSTLSAHRRLWWVHLVYGLWSRARRLVPSIYYDTFNHIHPRLGELEKELNRVKDARLFEGVLLTEASLADGLRRISEVYRALEHIRTKTEQDTNAFAKVALLH